MAEKNLHTHSILFIPYKKYKKVKNLPIIPFEILRWSPSYFCEYLAAMVHPTMHQSDHFSHSLARVITNTLKYQHITPTLKKLHWLPIKQRIDYKIWLLTYKTLTNKQPTYLYNSLSFQSHSVSTRSSASLVLSIPYVWSSLGKRTFSVIGPRLWNSLPPDTRNSSSLPIFRSMLKTHLFKIAFPP